MRYQMNSHLVTGLVLAGMLTMPILSHAAPAKGTASTTAAVPASPQATAATAARVAPATETDKLSYTIGVDMGTNLKAQNLGINADMLAQGIKDAMSGAPLLLTKPQMDQTLDTFQKQLMAKQQQAFAAMAEDNAKKGADFLAKNKTQPGVQTLADGLQYKIVDPGSGTPPTANDTVTVDYEGTLIDGTVFDSTYKRGKPASFKVSQVIPGWQEALKMMKPGAQWMLYIPSQLAYGKQGVGGPIGPNETLVFKVKLISVGDNAAS